ncbi:hypothetical protein DITRI_Ditri08aG0059500 [Diplodiscus trichospermus]
MAGETEKIAVTRQNSEDTDKFLEGAASFADMMFGFLDGSNESEENLRDFVDRDENDDDDEDPSQVEQNKLFWEAQEQLLQAILHRTTSLESKIRQATREALRELDVMGVQCVCRRPVAWRSSLEMPSGEHTYLKVLDKSNPKKGEVRVVIELNFPAEFEIARANEHYKKLIARLPELLVGNTERLKALIKILCSAAKKCMKEKKNALGSLERAQVHASQVARNIRENNAGTIAGGIFGAATEAQGFHANL